MQMLGFMTPNFLPIFVKIIGDLAKFQAWIWIEVCISKVLNTLDVRNVVDTKLNGLRACKCQAECLFIDISVVDSVLYGAKCAHRGTGT